MSFSFYAASLVYLLHLLEIALQTLVNKFCDMFIMVFLAINSDAVAMAGEEGWVNCD